MADPQPPKPRLSPKEEKLAEALRANLRRRKAATRPKPPAPETEGA